MYNTDMPTRAELPSSQQLLRSTITAMLAAVVILVTVVLPAEYAIDPTGIGRALGLTEMGEIKAQLANEAEQDRAASQAKSPQSVPTSDKRSSLPQLLLDVLVSPAAAQPAKAFQKEEVKITLKPGEYKEAKLDMKKGAKAKFSWSVAGGVVNFDMHGEVNDKSTSYAKGTRSAGADGVLEAAFDGAHGWFWRNRGSEPVTVTLRAEGEFSGLHMLP